MTSRVLTRDAVAGQQGDYTVDAAVVAEALGLSESRLREEMKAGNVFSTVERGEGEDEGRYRLTFRYHARYFCIMVDTDGTPYEIPAPMDIVAGSPVRLH